VYVVLYKVTIYNPNKLVILQLLY